MKRITLAYAYTDAGGKRHAPDTTISLDNAEANRLLHDGLAREPEKSAAADTEKKG